MRLGISTYSFWRFKGRKQPLKTYLKKACDLGFSGVEILQDHIESTSPEYLKEIRRFAFLHGLSIYCISIHNDFVNPSKEERRKEIEFVKKWIDVAYTLGATAIRINSGRWRTIKSFDELMARGGIEPPIEGYTDEDAIRWVVESIEACLTHAEDRGIILGLENHWGLTTRAEQMLKIVRMIRSDWFGVIMDTGNFIYDTYRELELIAPYTVMVHAKTYFGGGLWYTLDLDYSRIFQILRKVGFRGWISLEYEGKEECEKGILKSKELLEGYL